MREVKFLPVGSVDASPILGEGGFGQTSERRMQAKTQTPRAEINMKRTIKRAIISNGSRCKGIILQEMVRVTG